MIRTDYPGAAVCAEALADALADALGKVLAEKPRATLALSGGRSPRTVLPLLAAKPIDWSRVDVTLVDERRVHPDHQDSNAGLVRRCFLERGAQAAGFVPLWTGTMPLDAALDAATRKLAPILPCDVAYLGMGTDGHIASLFSAADAAAFESATSPVIQSAAPSAPRGRISLTLSELLRVRYLFLHVSNAEKHEVLERAEGHPPSPAVPVSLLVHKRLDIKIFACP
ncbi:6-phosphogluconolactonase [Thalassospiraceae bacterium LMO-JJ14]|nr:6-phosphogluconolactonase [Thalassospiraceae bacterium LMO-JJ14]